MDWRVYFRNVGFQAFFSKSAPGIAGGLRGAVGSGRQNAVAAGADALPRARDPVGRGQRTGERGSRQEDGIAGLCGGSKIGMLDRVGR